jgi:hypothetical protein
MSGATIWGPYPWINTTFGPPYFPLDATFQGFKNLRILFLLRINPWFLKAESETILYFQNSHDSMQRLRVRRSLLVHSFLQDIKRSFKVKCCLVVSSLIPVPRGISPSAWQKKLTAVVQHELLLYVCIRQLFLKATCTYSLSFSDFFNS